MLCRLSRPSVRASRRPARLLGLPQICGIGSRGSFQCGLFGCGAPPPMSHVRSRLHEGSGCPVHHQWRTASGRRPTVPDVCHLARSDQRVLFGTGTGVSPDGRGVSRVEASRGASRLSLRTAIAARCLRSQRPPRCRPPTTSGQGGSASFRGGGWSRAGPSSVVRRRWFGRRQRTARRGRNPTVFAAGGLQTNPLEGAEACGVQISAEPVLQGSDTGAGCFCDLAQGQRHVGVVVNVGDGGGRWPASPCGPRRSLLGASWCWGRRAVPRWATLRATSSATWARYAAGCRMVVTSKPRIEKSTRTSMG